MTLLRLLLGFTLLLFGIDGYVHFLPHLQAAPAAQQFLVAIGATGYLFPLVKLIELLVGLSLLTNRYITLALIIYFPIAFNVLLLHLFLDPFGLIISIPVFVIHLILIWRRRNIYSILINH